MKPITKETEAWICGIGYWARFVARRLLESGFKLDGRYDRNRLSGGV